ncbi:MAG: hypothetical protein AAF962_03640 [Actinomycetota bacterium]
MPSRKAEIDTLVVGAGPHALTVVSRWICERPARVDDVVIVDPAGTWMQEWYRQLHRQRIDVLRSPGVHHPDPDAMALLHAHRFRTQPTCRGGSAGKGALRGPLRRPATGAFDHFCRNLVTRTGLTDRVVQARVVQLVPITDAASPWRWEAALSDGARLRVRQVVWAGNPRVRCVPAEVELADAVMHSGEVDVATAGPGQRIAVLGGGQTAGQLALEAARAGAEVALISRGPRRVVELDVEAGWLMDDHLVPFRSIADLGERRRVAERARRGSMSTDLVDDLARSAVRWFADAGELSARPDGEGAVVGVAGARIDVDRVWVATGSTPDLRAEPVLARRAADGAPHVDGWPILDDRLRWEDGLLIVGGLAALTLGPAAGNLGGARAAAELLADDGPVVPDRAPTHPTTPGAGRFCAVHGRRGDRNRAEDNHG